MRERLLAFMDEHIYPNEARFFAEIAANRAAGNAWIPTKIIEELKPKARAAGLWNLFLPRSPRAPEGLSNLEYAPMCEIMGRVPFAAEVFNCSAPRHREHGDLRALRQRGAQGPVAGAAAAGRDPFGLPDDRAGSGLERCHQHPVPHRARGRRVRHQWPQVVVVRCR